MIINKLLDILDKSTEKVFSGRYVLCVASAYVLAFGGLPTEVVSTAVGSIITFYFTKNYYENKTTATPTVSSSVSTQ